VLRRLGGWDAWKVTEDADLGMRTRALGYEVDVIDSVTWGEAPYPAAPLGPSAHPLVANNRQISEQL
jgi:hypothetical protein